jgi:hypothetical protein
MANGHSPIRYTQLNFLVATRTGGGYCADAIGHPIRVEGDRIRDLRRAVSDAVRAHFGREPVHVRLLVGGSQAAEPAVAATGIGRGL